MCQLLFRRSRRRTSVRRAVFGEAQHLHLLGAFQRPLLELPEAAPPSGHRAGIRMGLVAAAKPGARRLRARPTASWSVQAKLGRWLSTLFEGLSGRTILGWRSRPTVMVQWSTWGVPDWRRWSSACRSMPVPVSTSLRRASSSPPSVLLLARDGVLTLSDDIRDHLPESWIRRTPSSSACVIPPACRSGLLWWHRQCSGDQAHRGPPPADPGRDPADQLRSRRRILLLQHRVCPGCRDHQASHGLSLREFSAERIFGPLGMADPMWRDDSSEVLPRFTATTTA